MAIQLEPMNVKGRRKGKSPTAIELHAVSVRPEEHFTRVWSSSSEATPLAFRLAVLPVRLLALGLLWATSSPQRLSMAMALTGVIAVFLLA